jgi:hypothetical protein
MDASYASDWPVLPGTEPRPATPIQWPSPPRVALHAAVQLIAQSPTQLPNQVPTGGPTMPLPPQAQYESYNALYCAAQLFAKNHGYAFTSRQSKKINH